MAWTGISRGSHADIRHRRTETVATLWPGCGGGKAGSNARTRSRLRTWNAPGTKNRNSRTEPRLEFPGEKDLDLIFPARTFRWQTQRQRRRPGQAIHDSTIPNFRFLLFRTHALAPALCLPPLPPCPVNRHHLLITPLITIIPCINHLLPHQHLQNSQGQRITLLASPQVQRTSSTKQSIGS